MELQKVILNQLEVDSALEARLFTLFKKSISSDISLIHFRKLFSGFDKLELGFYMHNKQDVGFQFITTFKLNKKTIIVRPGVGMLPAFRKNGFKSGQFALSIFKEKILNPTKDIFIFSINVNPIVYAGVCKYWAETYPSPKLHISNKYHLLYEQCIQHFGLNMYDKFVSEIPFSIMISKEDINRMSKHNEYIDYFFSQIPFGHWNKGVLTLTPVHTKNLMSIIKSSTRKKKKSLNGIRS